MRPLPSHPMMKKWAARVFIVCFAFLWLSFMTSALISGACLEDRYQGQKKLTFCRISIVTGFWIDVSAVGRAKRSRLHLEKGIALAQLGNDFQARVEFKRALSDAKAHTGPWRERLEDRMAELHGTHAADLFATEAAQD